MGGHGGRKFARFRAEAGATTAAIHARLHFAGRLRSLPSVCEDATAPSLFQAFSCRCVEWDPRGHRFLITNCQIIQSKTQRTIVHIVFSVVVVPLIVLSFLSPISSPPLHGVSFILAFCASLFHLPLGKFHFKKNKKNKKALSLIPSP